MKKCPKCGILKPKLSGFYRNRTKKDGYSSYCKKCMNNPEYRKARSKYRADNKSHIDQYNKKYYSDNKLYSAVKRRNKTKEDFLKIVTAYGGKCTKCGESRPEALMLHHPEGRGREHRRSSGGKFYSKLISQGFPSTVVLLCGTCHIIEHRQIEFE